MSIIGTIHEDVTSDVLGKIGIWQWWMTFSSTVLMMPVIFNPYEDMFLIQPSEISCDLPPNYEAVNTSLCFISNGNNSTFIDVCKKWNLKLIWFIWLSRSWLIFCDHDKKWLSTAIISRFGYIFGYIMYGLIADSFGRRTAITINVFMDFGLGLILTFCDSEGWFRLLVFLKSLFGSASQYIGLVIICEIASNSWRSRLSGIVAVPRLVASLFMVPLANTMPNIETYSFIACLFGGVYLVVLRWYPESIHWLLYNRKIHIAEKIVSNAARINGVKLCEDFKIRPINHKAYSCLDEPVTCMGVLATYNIRSIFIVSSLFWLLFYFLWSTIYVRAYSDNPKDHFFVYLLCSITMLVLLTATLSIKLSLKNLLFLHVLITGTLTAIVITVGKISGYSLLCSIALSSGLMVHVLILNITPRLFAINIRAMAFGFCHATGQMGSIISYLLFLFYPMNNAVLVSFAVTIMLFLVGLCFLIPNVDGRELPDVMEDMDYFSELSKPLRWATQKTNSPSQEEVQIRIYSFTSGGQTQSRRNSEERNPAQHVGLLKAWGSLLRNMRLLKK